MGGREGGREGGKGCDRTGEWELVKEGARACIWQLGLHGLEGQLQLSFCSSELALTPPVTTRLGIRTWRRWRNGSNIITPSPDSEGT